MSLARAFPRRLLVLACLLSAGCTDARARALNDLVVVDSVYVDPENGAPFSGRVVRRFEDDSTAVQIEGSLVEGVWEGEMIVYHPNGRVRYMGTFSAGERCGPWVENADSLPIETVYEELVREVESMGLYPPCDDSS